MGAKRGEALSVAAVYLVSKDQEGALRIAVIERAQADVFGYYYGLVGGSTTDRCQTDRRVKRRTAISEAREEVGVQLDDSDIIPAQRNPKITINHGVKMKFYTYVAFLSTTQVNQISNLEPTKHKRIIWLTPKEILGLVRDEEIHPAVANGWWKYLDPQNSNSAGADEDDTEKFS